MNLSLILDEELASKVYPAVPDKHLKEKWFNRSDRPEGLDSKLWSFHRLFQRSHIPQPLRAHLSPTTRIFRYDRLVK